MHFFSHFGKIAFQILLKKAISFIAKIEQIISSQLITKTIDFPKILTLLSIEKTEL